MCTEILTGLKTAISLRCILLDTEAKLLGVLRPEALLVFKTGQS
jgi:hypothetical protein